MTIANVANQFMAASKGISPTMGAARGFKAGRALGQRDRELDNRTRALEQQDELIGLKEDANAEATAQRLANLSKEDEEKLKRERTGVGVMLWASQQQGEDITPKLEALKKHKPDLVTDLFTPESLDMYIAENDIDGKATDTMDKWYKRKNEQEVADRQYGLNERKFAEQQRTNLAKEDISRNKAGTTMEVGPDGTMRVSMGGSQPLGKKLATDVEGKAFDAQEGMARLSGIREAFKPELMQLPAAVKEKWASAKSFLNMNVSPEERNLVNEKVTLYRRTADHLSQFIKSMSGAAVSVEEAKRLGQALPTAADSPLVFEAKLNDAMKSTQRALWRYNYAMRKGLNPAKSGVSIYDMDDIIEREGQTIELDVRRKNPGMEEAQVDDIVRQQLVGFFGTI